MRTVAKLAALLLPLLLSAPTVSLAAPKKPKKAAAAPAGPKVVVTAKSVLRAAPEDKGKPLVKVKPKEKVNLVGRSEDSKWIMVKKGKVAGWIAAAELSGLPSEIPPAPGVAAAPAQQTPAQPAQQTPAQPQVVEKIVEKI